MPLSCALSPPLATAGAGHCRAHRRRRPHYGAITALTSSLPCAPHLSRIGARPDSLARQAEARSSLGSLPSAAFELHSARDRTTEKVVRMTKRFFTQTFTVVN